MSQQEDADDFYAAGRKLAKYIADSKGKAISTATLQALMRDLLPQHEELQEALRSIVARPMFFQLLQLIGSGRGAAEKLAFIESLRKAYSAETARAADSLVCGMMGLGTNTIPSESGSNKVVVDTLPKQAKGSRVQVDTQVENPSQESHVQGKSREAAENLIPVPQSRSLRSLTLVLATALLAGGIWEIIRVRVPESKIDSGPKPTAKDYGAIEHVPDQLQAQRDCPVDLNANPVTVASATEVTLISKGVRWAGIGYLGGLRELHNGAFAGEKTLKLKGGIEISTDNPRALYIRFGDCPAMPMQRASYQQLRGRWDYGPKSASDPSCIPGNKGNPLLLNCRQRRYP
jgi:hypothetical protein